MRDFLLISCFLTLFACTGQSAPSQVQLCLGDRQNAAAFKDAMRSIAHAQGMNFVDGSASTEKDLIALNQHPGYEIIYIGISGEGGIGLEAINLGLSEYEVVIGFSQGPDPARAQRFEGEVIKALGARWQLHEVPPSRGALPLTNCAGEN